MNAALQNTGRSEVQERVEGMVSRGREAVRATFHVSHGDDPRSKQERRAELNAEAATLKVSRLCFV